MESSINFILQTENELEGIFDNFGKCYEYLEEKLNQSGNKGSLLGRNKTRCLLAVDKSVIVGIINDEIVRIYSVPYIKEVPETVQYEIFTYISN